MIFKMVSSAVKDLEVKIITQSFELVGITPHAKVQPAAYLNARLRCILGYEEGLDVMEPDSEDEDDPFEDEDEYELDGLGSSLD